ncbi:MAG: NUDIX hydrolase, partial [Clostridia bacterium]|nr:NUDIX hydrolase [Clostridia bacterium]
MTDIVVFKSSPMLEEETGAFDRAFERVNKELEKKDARLVLKDGRSLKGGAGDDAQDVVNMQINGNYDIYVMLMRDRVGTPTRRFPSGTWEEYIRARIYAITNPMLKRHTFFLKEGVKLEGVPDRITDEDVVRANAELLDYFKKKVVAGLYDEYDSLDQLENKLVEVLRDDAEELLGKKQEEWEYSEASAVAFICENKVLMVKRSRDSQHGPGFWQLPGGKQERNETALQCAVRECREELGLTDIPEKSFRYIADVPTKSFDKSHTFTFHLFVVRLPKMPDITLNEENENDKWIDVTQNDNFG